jgi:small-conductance mechanosensitive channel
MVMKKGISKKPLINRGNKKNSSWSVFDTMKHIAGGVFSGMLAYILAKMIVALFSLFWIGIGYYILKNYNKDDTKLFEDLQPMQYIGISFIMIGVLPYLHYFFMFLMGEAAGTAWEGISDEF